MPAPLFLPRGFRLEREPGAPFISIVTATRDSAATLGATLASVAAQRCQELEHVVVDGDSSDGTCELVRAAAHGPLLVSEPDRGIYDAFNKGLGRARGELIAFLNSDDAFAGPDVTARMKEAAERHPEVDIFHGDVDLVDAGGAVVLALRFVARVPPDAPDALRNYAGMRSLPHQLPHPGTFVRRRLFHRIGGFDTSYRIAGDYDLLQRALRARARLRHVPIVVTRMRNDGVSVRQRRRADAETLRALLRNSDGVVGPVADYAQFHLRRALRARVARAAGWVGRGVRRAEG